MSVRENFVPRGRNYVFSLPVPYRWPSAVLIRNVALSLHFHSSFISFFLLSSLSLFFELLREFFFCVVFFPGKLVVSSWGRGFCKKKLFARRYVVSFECLVS
jgi:hypothetical protein